MELRTKKTDLGRRKEVMDLVVKEGHKDNMRGVGKKEDSRKGQ